MWLPQRLGRIDSTGAGDAFAAGFLFALLRSGEDRDAPRDPHVRRAALVAHQAAASALRRGRPEIRLG